MKYGLEPGGTIARFDPAHLQYREYELAKLFGWTPDEIADAPGHWCDWAHEFAVLDQQRKKARG